MSPDAAWLAGVLDAIGRIRVRYADSGTALAEVAVSSPHVELLEKVAAMTGVKVTPVRRDYNRLGCSEHCREPHLHVESITGRWSLTGARAVIVLRAIRPHLVVLGPDADRVLAYAGDAPFKKATVDKMRALGWAA